MICNAWLGHVPVLALVITDPEVRSTFGVKPAAEGSPHGGRVRLHVARSPHAVSHILAAQGHLSAIEHALRDTGHESAGLTGPSLVPVRPWRRSVPGAGLRRSVNHEAPASASLVTPWAGAR
jgi:hypothetical protein